MLIAQWGFHSVGVGTDPHQSPIRIKAIAVKQLPLAESVGPRKPFVPCITHTLRLSPVSGPMAARLAALQPLTGLIQRRISKTQTTGGMTAPSNHMGQPGSHMGNRGHGQPGSGLTFYTPVAVSISLAWTPLLQSTTASGATFVQRVYVVNSPVDAPARQGPAMDLQLPSVLESDAVLCFA